MQHLLAHLAEQVPNVRLGYVANRLCTERRQDIFLNDRRNSGAVQAVWHTNCSPPIRTAIALKWQPCSSRASARFGRGGQSQRRSHHSQRSLQDAALRVLHAEQQIRPRWAGQQ